MLSVVDEDKLDFIEYGALTLAQLSVALAIIVWIDKWCKELK